MSYNSDPANQSERAEQPEQSLVESAPEAVVETIECANCGRVFTGNYCPECGQEADPSVSATAVIGGFFRELVDIENGFWPTFVGLTLRPGKTLRRYLSGVRKGLASPGRYLLTAVVVVVGIRQLNRWVGAEPPPVVDPYMTANGKREAFDASGAYYSSLIEQAPILPFLLITVPLAFSLWTLFRDRLSRGAEALAASSFLVGHTMLLAEGINLAFIGADHLLIGPSVELPFQAVIVFMIAYFGLACWGCFGPGWKPALKGVFGGAWAFAEVLATVAITFAGTAFWLSRAYPGAYYALDPGESQGWELLELAGIFCAPLLLHVGVEAYYRLR
jgi:hypothetical protein